MAPPSSWRGLELNFLTGSDGLPPNDLLARGARAFELEGPPATTVLVADPFDLLRNKLAVNREKDQPHIAFLRRFLDDEAVYELTHETTPRERIRTASRILDVLEHHTLDEPLAARLVPLARLPSDFRSSPTVSRRERYSTRSRRASRTKGPARWSPRSPSGERLIELQPRVPHAMYMSGAPPLT